MKEVEFPIRHLEGNLVFNTRGEVYAYYEVLPVDYTYRSPKEKIAIRNQWVRLFFKLDQEVHILSIPSFFDIQTHQELLKKRVPDGPLKKNALLYIDRITDVLKKEQKRPTQTRIFLGVKLRPEKARTTRKKAFKKFTFKWKDFKRYFQNSAGLTPYEILDEEISAYREQEHMLYQDIVSCLSVRKVTVTDFQYLIYHCSYRGMDKPIINNSWKPRVTHTTKNGQSVVQTNQQDIQNLILGAYEVTAHDLCVRRFQNGMIKEGWMQFLYMAYLPDDIQFPGEEWIYWLQHLSFPVDVSIRISNIPNQKAVEMVGRQKRRLGHYVNHTLIEGQQQDLDLEHAYQEAVSEEMNLKRGKEPLLETTILFCVYASSREELYERSQRLISFYQNQNKDMVVLESPGDHFLAFHEFLPGGFSFVLEFKHMLKPEMVASSMVNGTQMLGDSEGMFVGFTGPINLPREELDQPVFVHQARAAQGGSDVDTKSLGILIVGLTGYGKSYASSQLVYQSMHHLGAKVILIDSKGERGNWVTDLPGCQGQVSLLRMGSDTKYQGMLDPFLVFNREEAPLYAKDFLTQLVQVDRQHDWHHIIMESIQEARRAPMPSMALVLKNIARKDSRLFRVLATYASYPFSKLVFGTGKPPEHSLSLDQPLNIIQIDELRIPKREKSPRDYDELEILSKALMVPITGFVNQLVKKDRSIFNQIWWEECWIPLSSELGQRAINEGIRMGRYWNSGTLLVTQNPTDIPGELVNNIGMKFIFKTKEEDQVTRALEILELENTEANRRAIQNLKEGEAFFRDVYGRVGRIYFNCLFKELAEAFDTTPPMEEVVITS